MSAPEEWRPIPGYEGLYEVSDLGRVRSLDREWRQLGRAGKPHLHRKPGRILRPGRTGRFGHVTVALGRGNSRSVHALVMLAFVGPRPAGHDVAHNNGDASDNRLTNLRYATRRDNNLDKAKHGRCRVPADVVTAIRQGGSPRELSRQYGVSLSYVHAVRKGAIRAEA